MLQGVSQLQAVRNQEGIFIMGGLLYNYIVHGSASSFKVFNLDQ